jgi:hypothetical protein
MARFDDRPPSVLVLGGGGLLDRAEAEGTTTSELIREALRRYLRAA